MLRPHSVFHMQKLNRMPRCAARTQTLFHRTFPMLLLPSVCVRPKNLMCVPSERGWMRTTKRWISMMMTMTMRRVLPRRRHLIVRLRIILFCTQLFNRFYIIMFDHTFSTSAAIQQVTLFKPPAGGHKWCPGSVISTVRLIAHTASICT